jgi:hypothetical protein
MRNHLTKLTLTILSILLATQLCFAQKSIEAEEYTVYSYLIKSVYDDDATSQFAIEKNTRSKLIEKESWKYLNKKLSPLDAYFVRDFNERNNSPIKLENQFNLKSKVNLLSESELEVIFKPERSYGETAEEDWANFRKKFQTFSLLSLSRVGFNKKRDKALVEFGSQYGYLGGEGHFYLLVKRNNEWKIKKKILSWIS